MLKVTPVTPTVDCQLVVYAAGVPWHAAAPVVQVTVTGEPPCWTTEEGRSRAMTCDEVGVELPPLQTLRLSK